jgi:hypothetical protein
MLIDDDDDDNKCDAVAAALGESERRLSTTSNFD